ncbi:MAG TPA: hypothetical protein VMM82_09690, partial [Spirochaetia bacterium]|nr:hypothetical protein [Spirochaetia bacterium]
MKSLCLPAALCAVLLVSCASAPSVSGPAAPPLPQVRIKEIGDQISSGSFLQAYQEIAWLKRDRTEAVPEADLDALEAKSLDALSAAFTKAIQEKKYDDALRLFYSAQVAGKPALTGDWTEQALLASLASANHADGNDVVSLLDRIREFSAAGAPETDLTSALGSALALNNKAAIRFILGVMKDHGVALPADAVSAAQATPSF